MLVVEHFIVVVFTTILEITTAAITIVVCWTTMIVAVWMLDHGSQGHCYSWVLFWWSYQLAGSKEWSAKPYWMLIRIWGIKIKTKDGQIMPIHTKTMDQCKVQIANKTIKAMWHLITIRNLDSYLFIFIWNLN